MSKHQITVLIFGVLTIVYVYFFYSQSISLWGYLPLLLVFLFIVVYGSFDIRKNYHINAFHGISTKDKIVAITFDDGPSEYTQACLDLLEKHQQSATFFMIGKQIEAFPNLAKKVKEGGHTIGNHTYNHSKNTGFKSTKEIVDEIQKTDGLIKQITGKDNRFFRPPFGVTNPSIRKAVKKLGHQVVGWNVRSMDGVENDVDKVYHRTINKLKPGGIILLHDTSSSSVEVLERILRYLDENSYKSLTIEEFVRYNLSNSR